MPNERSTESNIEDTDSTQESQTSDQACEQLSFVSSAGETRNIVELETVNEEITSGTFSAPNPVFPRSNRKRMRQNKDEIISYLQKREETRQKALETKIKIVSIYVYKCKICINNIKYAC